MLYAADEHAAGADRVRLYRTPDEMVPAGFGDAAVGVAVCHDLRGRCVRPLWIDAESFDPAWSAPVELHADGSITVKGPIPAALIVGGRSGSEGGRPVAARAIGC